VVVVISHGLGTVPSLTASQYPGSPVPNVLTMEWWLNYTPLHLLLAGTEAVYVFFVLSGLVLALPYASQGKSFSWLTYYPARLVRIYVPVVASLMLAFALMFAVPRAFTAADGPWLHAHAELTDLGLLAKDALLLFGANTLNSPLWSLQWEVLFSLLLPIYVFVAVRANKFWIVAAGLIVVAMLASSYFSFTAMTYLLMFAMGVLFALNMGSMHALGLRIEQCRYSTAIWWAVIATSAAALMSYWVLRPLTVSYGVMSLSKPIALVGAAGIVFVAAFWPTARRLFETKAILWLGAVSFSLYLVHEPIVVSLAALTGDRTGFIAIGFGIPLSLGVAWVFFRFVEAPSHRLAAHVKRTMAAARPALKRGGPPLLIPE